MENPCSVTLVRHAESEYNALRAKKEADPLYKEFQHAYETDIFSQETRTLAQKVKEKFAMSTGDYNTRLTEKGIRQAKMTGEKLSQQIPCPDFIFISPYYRTKETLLHMSSTWTELQKSLTITEELIREHEYGIGVLYNDWRVFQTFHPEQKEYRELATPYWYRYPQGESIPDVRQRIEIFKNKYSSIYAEKNVLIISHHRTILSFVANQEEMSSEELMLLDKSQPPISCGVTHYKNAKGKLELLHYNKKLWTE